MQKRKKTFLIGGMCLCVVAMVLSVFPGVRPTVVAQGLSWVVVPMQQGTSRSISWFQGRFAAMTDNERLLSENAALREENIRLALEIEQLHLAGEENYYLTHLLEMRQRFPELLTLGARVIAINPNNWRSRFVIEAGARDGIAAHMPVLAGDAVKGIIRYAGPRHAEVITILDSEFSIAVHSVRAEAGGIVRGDIQLAREGLVRMDFIAGTDNIMPGDTLVTSVYSPHFPPGLPVGTVVSVHPNPDGLTQHAIVEPAAGTARPQMVLVVTD
ncbi:MAG: rod shape-determining protein MreC [Defluviitaleaceae bacterium]|nr:rod shape-determining protein MreC [Defluviitaleaceae bacterium]MCL2240047.1 rod shape-determining protein MreC [Defluviitaleaceae bacterium]